MNKKLCIAIPTKLQVHANTILSLLSSNYIPDYTVDIRFLPGKSNIDQARSMLATMWYDNSNDDDLFLFIDSDQTFTRDDIIALIELNSDVAIGVYSSLNGRPACRPVDSEKFDKGEDMRVLYGGTGFMLIRRPILTKIEEFIKKERMGYSRYYISPNFPNVIPFFIQRLIISESVPKDSNVIVPEWLGEDYAFCWMVRQVGGTIKPYISKTIGHEVTQVLYYYPEQYNRRNWSENSIVFYTGRSRTMWSHNDIDSKGLGGSETAVIYLSKFWKQSGYDVTIYGNVTEGIFDGIEYINHNKFNTNDTFHTIVLWRAFGFSIINEIKSKYIYVDIHDIPSLSYRILLDYNEKITKIFVKSYMHKNLFPPELQEKMCVIQNGISSKYINHSVDNNKKRNRNKIIYASSYDRGLLEMLQYGWSDLKLKAPTAELHIYYGMELLPEAYKNKLLPLLQQEGVFEHGRIGQNELMEKKQECAIHYYLGNRDEVDCISVKESVLMGLIPVTSNNNVFTERNYCLKVDGQVEDPNTHFRANDIIAKLINDDSFYDESLEQINKYKNTVETWEQIAQKWINEFND